MQSDFEKPGEHPLKAVAATPINNDGQNIALLFVYFDGHKNLKEAA